MFLAEGTACTKIWQLNRVCSLGRCEYCGVARVENNCGAGGVRMGEREKIDDKEGCWVSGLGELGGWWPLFL